MKKIAILMLACVPLLCGAAGKRASATMDVSFTVTEACLVQSAGRQAQVQCSADTPYQLQEQAAARLSMDIAADGQPTVVYF